MNVLMVGNGKGSWTMRGIQLGAALGARVTTAPSDDDWRWANVAVLIKKHAANVAPTAHAFGVPIVWDAVDFWRQPSENAVTRDGACALARAYVDAIKPVLVIGATQAMADALGGVYLPHHSWSGLVPTPPREQVRAVAYQGNVVYLGRWKAALEQACARRGWTFVVNPSDMSTADILVAFRDGPWDGWICREWKSGVKAVNALASGRPLISQDSAGRREVGPDGFTVESFEELGPALDFFAPYAARVGVFDHHVDAAPAFTVDAVAAQYRQILASVQVAA